MLKEELSARLVRTLNADVAFDCHVDESLHIWEQRKVGKQWHVISSSGLRTDKMKTRCSSMTQRSNAERWVVFVGRRSSNSIWRGRYAQGRGNDELCSRYNQKHSLTPILDQMKLCCLEKILIIVKKKQFNKTFYWGNASCNFTKWKQLNVQVEAISCTLKSKLRFQLIFLV